MEVVLTLGLLEIVMKSVYDGGIESKERTNLWLPLPYEKQKVQTVELLVN